MKIQNRQQLLLVITLAAVALLIGDRLVFTPLTRAWSGRSQEIARLRQQVTEGAALLKRKEAIQGRWNDMQTHTLPNNPSLAQEQILRSFETWAQESGAGINAITPQWKNDAEDYKTLVCRVDASGSLWTLCRLLYDIEKGPLALKIEAVDLSSRDTSGQQLNLGLQISGLVLTPASP